MSRCDPLPPTPQKGWVIHPKNENPWNNLIINLYKLTKAEHNNLHKKGNKYALA